MLTEMLKWGNALSIFCLMPMQNTKRNVLNALSMPFQNVIFYMGVLGGV